MFSRTVRAVVSVLLVCTYLAVGSMIADAKGLPYEVTVSGPGLATPLTITDPFATASLGTTSFIQYDKPLTVAPQTGGTSFEIERDGFDHVRYYPGNTLNDSYVYDEGLLSGWSEYDGHWYYVSNSGDTTIRMLLVASGVQDSDVLRGMSPLHAGTLDRAKVAMTAESLSSRKEGGSADLPFGAWLALAGVAGLVVGGGISAFVRR